MSLTLVVAGNTVYAADINSIINRLQQPSGGSETQTVFYSTGAFQSGSTVGYWQSTSSQGATPGSVATGTTTLVAVGSLATSNLSSSGFYVSGAATGVSNTARFTTTWTVNY
jgi:hypothetical protein